MNDHDLTNSANAEMMDQAKESITKIEETTSRIHGIVHGNTRQNTVRALVRRRDDVSNVVIKRWVALLVFFAGLACAGLMIFTYHEIQLGISVGELGNRMTSLEVELRAHEESMKPPSQNLNLSQ